MSVILRLIWQKNVSKHTKSLFLYMRQMRISQDMGHCLFTDLGLGVSGGFHLRERHKNMKLCLWLTFQFHKIFQTIVNKFISSLSFSVINKSIELTPEAYMYMDYHYMAVVMTSCSITCLNVSSFYCINVN